MTHDEARIQADTVIVLSMAGIWLFSVPNESAGKATPQKIQRLKAMGLRTGITDLVLVGDSGFAHFLEIKTESGKLSESQVRFRDFCQVKGWPWAIARSPVEALAQAKVWGLA
jgi:hypothetical protein